MTDDEVLAQIKGEIEEIKKNCAKVPGEYRSGKSIMIESLEMLDRNPKKALKIMIRARESIGAESDLCRRYNSLRQKREAILSFQMDEAEMASERQLLELLRTGDFEGAGHVLKAMEDSMHLDVVQNVDSSLLLEIPDAEIVLGRGSTLEATAVNQSAFPLRIVTLTGRSVQAQVIVLEDYKGVIHPRSGRKVRINVIPGAEGDVVVEIEALVEVNSIRLTIKKHASVRVVQPEIAQEVEVRTAPSVQDRPAGNTANEVRSVPPAGNVHDPMGLIEKGTVDQWVDFINMMFVNRGTFNFEALGQTYPDFQKMEGYVNLFQAFLVMDYRPATQWSTWFETKGFTGNELTKRCSGLVFDMRTSPGMRLVIELDGSVGSSNNDHLIGALNIASGNILLPREKLKGIRTWEVRGTLRGKGFTLRVDRDVTKGEGGARSRAAFSLQIV